jgi:hypothetical protein
MASLTRMCWLALAIVNAAYALGIVIASFLGIEINVAILILDLLSLGCAARHLTREVRSA